MNDSQLIWEAYLREGSWEEGFFTGPTGSYSVHQVVGWAEKNGQKKTIDLTSNDPLAKAVHDNIEKWWQGDEERMMKADTTFPVLMTIADTGEISIADGLNRAKKIRDVEKRPQIEAYVVNMSDIPDEFRVEKS